MSALLILSKIPWGKMRKLTTTSIKSRRISILNTLCRSVKKHAFDASSSKDHHSSFFRTTKPCVKRIPRWAGAWAVSFTTARTYEPFGDDSSVIRWGRQSKITRKKILKLKWTWGKDFQIEPLCTTYTVPADPRLRFQLSNSIRKGVIKIQPLHFYIAILIQSSLLTALTWLIEPPHLITSLRQIEWNWIVRVV
jgi:hypothetical protein